MNEQYRKSPRANWINYEGGDFFITICTKDKEHFFGHIADGIMNLSSIGEIVDFELRHPHIHHPHIEIPLYVIMPNHIHAIIVCRDIACDVCPNEQRNPNPALRSNPNVARHVPSLSRYIGSFKAAVSREAHKINPNFSWQSRYHDHLIRGTREGNKIADYIENNVARWDSDCFNL